MNETQLRIVDFLQNAVEAEPAAIRKCLQISEDEFKRETAALRHMEKIRGRLKDGRVVLRLWKTEVEKLEANHSCCEAGFPACHLICHCERSEAISLLRDCFVVSFLAMTK